MKLKVTDYMIRKSKKLGGQACKELCPIALQLKNKLKPGVVEVDNENCYIWKKYNYTKCDKAFKLSRRARKFVVDFDTGKVVRPSTFILKEV
jgi:hypothetical protein